jgi:nucleotidyltransferase substrate binding protein (TIGR01987 family)
MALTRLDEALAQPDENLLIVDGTIQRFEFVIELYWKTLKRMLEEEGVRSGTPRETIRAAFCRGLARGRGGVAGDAPRP